MQSLIWELITQRNWKILLKLSETQGLYVGMDSEKFILHLDGAKYEPRVLTRDFVFHVLACVPVALTVYFISSLNFEFNIRFFIEFARPGLLWHHAEEGRQRGWNLGVFLLE